MLVLDQVSIAYGPATVVKDVGLTLQQGQIGCLLGPSGCGKTSLLRAIAGFEPVQTGSVLLAGVALSTPEHLINPEQRRIGMVFQDFALFPHLTVAQNIAFGVKKKPKAQQQQIVADLLALVGLPTLGERYVHQLSGGQQQRVALARALAPEPEVLLLDEPFSGLDADLREALAQDIRGIIKQRGISALMVTHDQFEAFAMADQIGVMQHGKLQQWGSAYELYHQPANRFVADFVGHGALLKGEVLADGQVYTALGAFTQTESEFTPGATVDLLVRPDDIVHDDESGFTAKVVGKSFRGSHILYSLELEGAEQVYCLAPSHHNHQLQSRIGIKLELDHLVLFQAQSHSL
ncbi:MAG: ABC transporter ATP-binding protein [Gammaproteobacteria bacterium]|nr:ABC transporter ATP-binding protein [Gammaproteobacteria bacterium]MBU2057354.1 ABC transporter ATP-binding protein [Gammaproteobacteria bacterium]MBU2175947.1 ABC transporter ATP-binding protein [Gammaproteobacteria bacterium]MBU2248924.1 ABC transporter ATP-binding protein [Gammaproteobacteria bacterium]MBU2343910.1 ABC transporter ATP-binding protein [Gammaproteobacteria bacterium]